MKKMLFAILCGLLFYCPLSAQIDSLFYYVDKTRLNNDVLVPYSDSSLWARNHGHNNQIIENAGVGFVQTLTISKEVQKLHRCFITYSQ